MHMLYNSENFAVVRFDVPVEGDALVDASAAGRGGYEIVDKSARKEIYLQGVLAESFRAEVQALIDGSPTEEAVDDYLGRYSSLMQQPLVLH